MERILGADRPMVNCNQYRIRDSAKHYRTLVKRAELITLNILGQGRIIFTMPTYLPFPLTLVRVSVN